MGRELHALRLAARKRGGRLSQAQISQPHFFEHAIVPYDFGHAGKEMQSFPHGQVQDFMNVLAAIAYV